MQKKENKNIPFIQVMILSVIGTVLFFIFLAVFAYVALELSVSQSSYFSIGLVMSGISGLISGFISAKLIKEKGIIYGGLTGFIQSVFSSVIVFCLNKGTAGNSIFILIILTTLLASVGGVAAVNIKKKIKY